MYRLRKKNQQRGKERRITIVLGERMRYRGQVEVMASTRAASGGGHRGFVRVKRREME